MRVLFLNPAGNLGGAERSLLDLVASIRVHPELGSTELGLIAGANGPLIEAASHLGVHVRTLPLTKHLATAGDSGLRDAGKRLSVLRQNQFARAALEIPGYALRLRAAIREFAPTVVHSNGIKMHLLAAAIRDQTPLVWHIRDFVSERPVVRRAMRTLAERADAAIAISNAVAGDARPFMGRTPVSVVYNAVDTDLFAPEGPVADLDRLAGVDAAPRGAVRVGLVATFARWKGHDIFLDAARRVVATASTTPVRFYVVGGPIYDTAASQFREDELRAMVRERGLDEWVTFVPFQNRVDAAYRALDVVVHASCRREPFGRTIAEAMATGRPVVASRESGAAEMFEEGVDALAFQLGDTGVLAQLLLGLIAESRRREALGRAARSAAVEHFSRGRLASQILEVYATVAARSNPVRAS
jgi:glycosyltransferase involved in cell wall biosynthesis